MDVPESADSAHAAMQRFLHRAMRATFSGSIGSGDELEECRRELDRLLKLRPGDGLAMMNMHWLLKRVSHAAKADALMKEFAESSCKEPQAVAWFGRVLSEKKDYDRALAVLSRVEKPLGDYLGDEIALEKMRAHAAKGDIAALLKVYADRMEKELSGALDRFHFMYHRDEMIDRKTELGVLWLGKSAEVEAGLKRLMESAKDDKVRLVHTMSLSALYSRLERVDDQVDLMLRGMATSKQIEGWRHYFYRTCYGIIETMDKETAN